MSRYTILLILNTPFILAGVVNALVAHKVGRLSQKKFWLQLILWFVILCGLFLAQPIYHFLFTNNLTNTEPLSLFDVIQITGIVWLLYTGNRARGRLDLLERRMQELHRELSIRLAKDTRP